MDFFALHLRIERNLHKGVRGISKIFLGVRVEKRLRTPDLEEMSNTSASSNQV